MSFELNVPVAFIIFNRPDTTQVVFDRIRAARPKKLYIISDAPRDGREDDLIKVAETRCYVESHIDWECEVHKNYAESNMGCKRRVASGISWVLEHEERTIILEDDVVPSDDFFPFMQEMLDFYNDSSRVMMISGTNLLKNYEIEGSYTFSCFSSIWGWATWRRAWEQYDIDVKDWPRIDKEGSFRCVQNGLAYTFLKKHMDSVYTHEKDTWDIQWDYCRHKARGLGVVPKVNMINNIGFDRADATHTNGSSDEDFSYGKLSFPLEHAVEIKRDVDYDEAYIRKYYGVKNAIGAVLRRMPWNKK